MSTTTSLKFAVTSSWDGKGIAEAKKGITSLKAEIESMSNSRLRLQVELDGIEEAKAKIEEAAKNTKAVINADADTAAAESKLDETARDRKANIDADADTASATSKLDETARNRKSNIDADADTGAAEAKIAEVSRNRRMTITVDADTGAAQGKLAALTSTGLAAKLAMGGALGAINAIGPAAAMVGGGLMTGLGAGIIGVGALSSAMYKKMQSDTQDTINMQQAQANTADNQVAKSFKHVQEVATEGAQNIATAQGNVAKAQENVGVVAQNSAYQIQQANDRVSEAQENVGLTAQAGARAIQQANLQSEQANRQLEQSQKQVTQSYEDARRSLQDLQMQQSMSADNIEAAAIAVERAKQRVAEGPREGSKDPALDQRENLNNLALAQDHYRATVLKAQQTNQDYQKAQQEGIEGSSQVVAAKQAEADAQRKAGEAAQNVKDVTAKAAQDNIKAQRDLQQAVQAQAQAQAKAAQDNARAQQQVADAITKLGQVQQMTAVNNEKAQQEYQNSLIVSADAHRQLDAAMAKTNTAGMQFMRTLNDIVSPMQGPLHAAFQSMMDQLEQMKPALQSVFTAASPLIQPLVDGVMSAVRNMVPGITQALQGMGPLFGGLSNMMGTLGGSIGRMFASMGNASGSLGKIAADFGTNFGKFIEMWGDFVGKTGPAAATTLQKMGEGINALTGPALQGMAGFMQNTAGGASMLGGAFAAIGQALQTVLPALGKFQEAFAKGFSAGFGQSLQIIASAFATILQVLTPLAPVLGYVVGVWLAIKMALGPLGMIIMGIAKAMALVNTVITIARSVWFAFNVVLAANPFVIIGLAIAALIAGIVLLATKTQFFQNIWSGIKTAWNAVWNFIKTAFDAFVKFISGKWGWLLALLPGIGPILALAAHWKQIWNAIKLVVQVIWDWMKSTWTNFLNGIKLIWTVISTALRMEWQLIWNTIKMVAFAIWNWLKTTWNNIVTGFKIIWDIISGAISAAWNMVWSWIRDVASGIWNWLGEQWNNFLTGVKFIWDVVSKALGDAWNAVWNWIKDVAKGIWDWISRKWDDFLTGVKFTWDLVSTTIRNAWNKFWDTIKSVAEGIWDGIKKAFDGFTDGLKRGFEWIVGKAKEIWDGIKKIFAEPINFVFNAISDTVGTVIGALKFEHDPVKFADGGSTASGMQHGFGGSRADRNLVAVSGHEYVVNGEAASKPGMQRHLDAINFGGLDVRDIPAPISTVNNFAPLGPNVTGGFKDGGDVDKGPHGEPSSIEAVQRAMDWASSKAGKEYNAEGWLDCSGLASGVYDSLLGRTPQREFTTVSDFQALGFVPGQGGMFDIGVTPLPGDQGHMAMSLAGHNIESAGGGKGIQIDGSALSASDGSFSDHYFLPGNLYSPQFFGTGWNGSSGDKSIWGKITGAFGSAVRGGRGLLASALIKMTDPIINAIPAPMPGFKAPAGNFVKDAVKKVRDSAADMVRGHESTGQIGGTVPEGDRAKIIEEALAITNTPPPGSKDEWMRGMNTLIERESGWNAGARNDWDSNAAAGNNSVGLAQVIPTTFEANKAPGHDNIYDPVDNVAASINYIKSRYGSIDAVQQANANMAPKGYATGTRMATPGPAMVGEQGPELIKFKDSDGTYYGQVYGQNGPVQLVFNGGEEVYDAAATKKFFEDNKQTMPASPSDSFDMPATDNLATDSVPMPDDLTPNSGAKDMKTDSQKRLDALHDMVGQKAEDTAKSLITTPIDSIATDLGLSGGLTNGSGFIPQLFNNAISYGQTVMDWNAQGKLGKPYGPFAQDMDAQSNGGMGTGDMYADPGTGVLGGYDGANPDGTQPAPGQLLQDKTIETPQVGPTPAQPKEGAPLTWDQKSDDDKKKQGGVLTEQQRAQIKPAAVQIGAQQKQYAPVPSEVHFHTNNPQEAVKEYMDKQQLVAMGFDPYGNT